MPSKADKYRGHADPTVAHLAAQLHDAEEQLELAARARSQAALAANTARGEEERAQQRVDRLADAIAVVAGDPAVRVERTRR